MSTAVDRNVSVREGRRTTKSMSDGAILLAVALSPFQKALTIDAGFPLKPTEILIILAVPLMLLDGGNMQKKAIPKEMKAQANWLFVLALLVVISAFAHFEMSLPRPPYPGYGRSLTVDMLLYVGYAVMVFVVWRRMAVLSWKSLSTAMAWAVKLTAVFCVLQWYLFETNNISLIKAIGYEMVLGRAFGVDIPRNGPFFEGNNLGVFAAIALLIMFRRRDRVGVLAAVFCVVYSQSTSAVVVLAGSLAVAAFSMASPKWRARVFAGFVVVVAVIFVAPNARQYVHFQAAKLGVVSASNTATGARTDYSRDVRGAKTQVGFKMAVENPVVGVGPGRFGAWFAEYANPKDFPPYYLSGGPKGDSRRIAENGYMQVAAEIGLVALIAIGMFLFSTVMAMRRVGFIEFAIAVAVIIAFVTAAAWTLLTLWIALGYLASVQRGAIEHKAGTAIGRTKALAS